MIKAIYLSRKNGKLILTDNNLAFSLITFLACGIVSIAILVLKRVVSQFERKEDNFWFGTLLLVLVDF